MKTSITLFAILLFGMTVAQTETPQEDKLFEKWEYFKAAKMYEQDAASHPTQDVYFKLGECYQKMCKYKEAKAAYHKVDSMGKYSNPEFYYNYAQILRNNGDYAKAKEMFKKYAAMNPSDARGEYYINACDIAVADHKNDFPIKIVNDSSLNTPQGDLSPVFYRDGIAFVSTRGDVEHHKIYGWTGGYYMDIFYAKKGKNNTDFKSVSTLAGGKK